jgi:hypothetical protein
VTDERVHQLIRELTIGDTPTHTAEDIRRLADKGILR